ncbi:MAG TPA: hypothetical protein VK983_02265 [Candidatus Limnocylindrales bacterium]|nr:hypothetical protein [Candidatus Limnocylindrales bacterium]
MPELLQPYNEFDPEDLAGQLHRLVHASREALEARNLHGVVARYGLSRELAEAKVRKGQVDHLDSHIGHYAIVNSEGEVRGSGSVFPNLPLYRLHMPVPPRIAFGPLKQIDYRMATNVAAWTVSEDQELLSAAYSELCGSTVTGKTPEQLDHAVWTTEPLTSPDINHEAITTAGMAMVMTGRFDEGENRYSIPPRARLYAWISDHVFPASAFVE